MTGFMDVEIAKLTERIVRDNLELDRAKRVMLLKEIREHGDGDEQQLATLQAAVRELDIRLARERAEMAAPAAR